MTNTIPKIISLCSCICEGVWRRWARLSTISVLLFVLAPFQTADAQTPSDAVTSTFEALKALYKSTEGGDWTNNTGWDTTAVPATMLEFEDWYGVRAIDEGVTSLDLGENNLKGTIPTEVGNLHALISLDFSKNSLTGTIPKEIGNLPVLLFLILSENDLTGEIPKELGGLKLLTVFDLGMNPLLTGSVPDTLGYMSVLTHIKLGETGLTGTAPRTLLRLRFLLNLELPTGVCTPEDDEYQEWVGAIGETVHTPCTSTQIEQDVLPEGFAMIRGNYPNPFTDHTTLEFDLTRRAEVGVRVVDLLGREVHRTRPTPMSAGSRKEIRIEMTGIPAGMYFYQVILHAEEETTTQTGTLTKRK